MNIIIDNINYRFIPSNVTSFKKDKLVLKNDIYEKYIASADIEGELIICNDNNQLRRFEKKLLENHLMNI